MQQQASVDTAPELRVRSALHRLVFRFRVHRAVIPGTQRKADIVFGPAKVAVVVDGCFWHGCPIHGTHQASTNTEYWRSKRETNRLRDADTDERLGGAGWVADRVWEHEDPAVAAARIAELVRARRAG